MQMRRSVGTAGGRPLVLVLLWGVVAARNIPADHDGDDLGDLPMQNPDLFGGDMLGIEDDQDRSAIVLKKQRWPGGVIPYELDPARADLEGRLLKAFEIYRNNTCIRFVKRTNETNYIRIIKGQGCYSSVGRRGFGMQVVSLGRGCEWNGTILHELAHAIGFYHEQNRSDRDEWLTIFWDNIMEGEEMQFKKLKPEENQLLTEFDYDSVMLYGEYAFSKESKVLKTMVAKRSRKKLQDVGKKTLSPNDIVRINKLYGCKDYVYEEE